MKLVKGLTAKFPAKQNREFLLSIREDSQLIRDAGVHYAHTWDAPDENAQLLA